MKPEPDRDFLDDTIAVLVLIAVLACVVLIN